jgi:UPF0716 protein FxsA
MPPLLVLFILFTAIPLVELWLLFQLSGLFGFWTTIAVVLGTGIVGASLARWQGWRVLARVQTDLRQGTMPADAIGDGVLILVAGVLLITPGVLTDLFGLSLLVPPIRILLKAGIRRWLAKHAKFETMRGFENRDNTTRGWQSATDGDGGGDQIIDARVIKSESEEDC